MLMSWSCKSHPHSSATNHLQLPRAVSLTVVALAPSNCYLWQLHITYMRSMYCMETSDGPSTALFLARGLLLSLQQKGLDSSLPLTSLYIL